MAIIDYKALFCVLMISSFTLQNEEEETNPFVEAARSLLQESLQGQDAGQGLGGMVQNFLRTDGGKQLGQMFAGQGAGAGDLLGGLGSLLAGAGAGGGNNAINPQLIGHLVEAFAGMAGSAKDSNSVDDNNNEVRGPLFCNCITLTRGHLGQTRLGLRPRFCLMSN